MEISQIWNALEECLERAAPNVMSTLRPPATASAITALESTLGRTLPSDFLAYLKVHDGQDDRLRLNIFCEEGNLLSTVEMQETWKMLVEIDESNPPGDYEWWARKYLPFSNIEGDSAAIDLDNGEVVMHVHDFGIERGLAMNFGDWFEKKLKVFTEGRFKVEDGYVNFWEF